VKGDGIYETLRRKVYGEGMTFVPVCFKCGRFVKADEVVYERSDRLKPGPNATCAKCGRTEMLFEGYL
jgi:DNA-directed RNA polymerase subunit M/transcription elongation factor TFIIS